MAAQSPIRVVIDTNVVFEGLNHECVIRKKSPASAGERLSSDVNVCPLVI